MRSKRKERFITVRSEGGLLPIDFLERIARLDGDIDGLKAEQYHLLKHEKINEAINRAWDRLVGCWVSFKSAVKAASTDDPLMRETRERWLLPLFDALGYGRLVGHKAFELDGKSFGISHIWQNTPIHLVGWGVELDRRTAGVAGAAKSAPHGMVQDFLNRSEDHLWAFVSNGKKLRVLRDNVSLTRQAFVEFDLEGMMDGEQFADFRLLWLLCHESRVEAEKPEECWLEKWTKFALESGIRVRDQLRIGVEKAINVLGTGFLQHPANNALRTKLRSGELTRLDYYRQVLRIVYRLLFLFVSEDRDLLLLPDAPVAARNNYKQFYSTQRMRELAGSKKGTQHLDLWQAQRLIFAKLGSDEGCTELALPSLGSFLWYTHAVPDLQYCMIMNRTFLDGIRALAYVEEGKARRAVDFKNLRSEELGSIYEALLEMHPHLDLSTYQFSLSGAEGSERKTTGSYYTPATLVSKLLDTALDPLIESASKRTDAAIRLLKLRICDPACGSGHFLIAAAHRIAKAVASARAEDAEPSPLDYRRALRDVISNCIFGVDVNEMSVELCKVGLWLESIEPGRPLSFLEHKVRCGNSLLGATPALVSSGIPDAAFDAIEGDEADVVRQVRTANRQQTDGYPMSGLIRYSEGIGAITEAIAKIDDRSDDSIPALHDKEQGFSELQTSKEYIQERFVCDAWCAAFVWKLSRGAVTPITREVFGRILSDYQNASPEILAEIRRLREQYKFFHWHLEFPQAFDYKTGEGGFDVLLGNPPWEHAEFKDREWFASRDPAIASAQTGAIRKNMIKALQTSNPTLYSQYVDELRWYDGVTHFIRSSGRFPLTGQGRINTYAVFCELFVSLVKQDGRAGFIVQSDIATGDANQDMFKMLVDEARLFSFYDFVNTEGLFPGLHRTHPHFCLITVGGPNSSTTIDFAFWNTNASHLSDPARHISLTPDDLALVNPNNRTCPIFRSQKDADITKDIHSRVPVLYREGSIPINPWMLVFKQGLFNMSSGSSFFETKKDLEQQGFTLVGEIFVRRVNEHIERFLPLYEGKMIHQFDHRWASYKGLEIEDFPITQKQDISLGVLPRYWVAEAEVNRRLGEHDGNWLLGWRDFTNSTNERTVISSFIPRYAVGDTLLLMFPGETMKQETLGLVANLNSFIVDFVARQKLGGTHMKYPPMKQLPILAPDSYSAACPWEEGITLLEWLRPRVLELIYTSVHLTALGDCFGMDSPFRWDEQRRHRIRCELDAAYFLLYNIERDDVSYILDTFDALKRREERELGGFRTKTQVLSDYDRLCQLSKRNSTLTGDVQMC